MPFPFLSFPFNYLPFLVFTFSLLPLQCALVEGFDEGENYGKQVVDAHHSHPKDQRRDPEEGLLLQTLYPNSSLDLSYDKEWSYEHQQDGGMPNPHVAFVYHQGGYYECPTCRH